MSACPGTPISNMDIKEPRVFCPQLPHERGSNQQCRRHLDEFEGVLRSPQGKDDGSEIDVSCTLFPIHIFTSVDVVVLGAVDGKTRIFRR